ncbi:MULTISPECIES: DUF4232 domain-containing protein [unclassified Kitasatospora]|uniref:DUF4232 domain-containing protein n=1 Tax=unclassified Kitasatospora TaxID=2633591 RepID=UPI0033CE143D
MRESEKPTPPPSARRPAAAVTLAVAAAALLTACGPRTTGASGAAGAFATPAASAGAAPCGAPLPAPAGGAQAPSGLARDGVRITAASPACAEYEVTNPNGEPSDVTVVFNRLSAAGAALDTMTHTVAALAPGATEKRRIDLSGPGPALPGAAASQVKIVKVRSVPSAEAPQPAGPCPASGLRLYADEGDAAMGLRVAGLHLRNCGTATLALDGYPTLQLLDPEHHPVDGVRLLSGGAEIATGTGADNPPQKIALRPGEGARATLVWRNTTGDGAPVNVPYVRVRATPDAAPVMVTPELDLGTTGRLGVGAWAREDAGAKPPATRPPAQGG